MSIGELFFLAFYDSANEKLKSSHKNLFVDKINGLGNDNINTQPQTLFFVQLNKQVKGG